MKDRAALFLIRDGERKGLLKKGVILVEATGGKGMLALLSILDKFNSSPVLQYDPIFSFKISFLPLFFPSIDIYGCGVRAKVRVEVRGWR